MKTKNKVLLLMLLTSLMFTNCKKGLFETCVEGKVINKKTGIVVANQKVYLLRETSGNGFGGLGFEVVSSTTSSLGGYYKFLFKAKGDKYFVQGTDDSGLDPRFFSGQATGGIKNTKSNTVDINLTPKAFLRLKIQNINPFDSNDKFAFLINGGGEQLLGVNVSYDKIIPILGDENVKLEYGWTKNNMNYNKDTTINVPSYSNIILNINY